jgi:hypothetical protein
LERHALFHYLQTLKAPEEVGGMSSSPESDLQRILAGERPAGGASAAPVGPSDGAASGPPVRKIGRCHVFLVRDLDVFLDSRPAEAVAGLMTGNPVLVGNPFPLAGAGRDPNRLRVGSFFAVLLAPMQ